MIGIFDDAGDRLTISYNGLSLNVDSDDPDNTYAVDAVMTVPQYASGIEPRPNGNGSELTAAYRTFYLVRIDGVVRATTLASLYEKKKALAKALDPAVVYDANQSVDGAIALDFTVLTTDTTNYATGKVTSRYYARPRTGVIPPDSAFTGTSCFFSAELIVPDPVRYSQTEYTLSGAGTANLSAGDHKSYPTLTITMAGAGSATYKIDCGTPYLTLDLSGCVASDVVVVDMAKKSIKKNGVETQSLYVAGDWFALPAASNTITYTNGTNATSVLAWRRAWTV